MLLPPPARTALERLGVGPIKAFTAPIDAFAIHHPMAPCSGDLRFRGL